MHTPKCTYYLILNCFFSLQTFKFKKYINFRLVREEHFEISRLIFVMIDSEYPFGLDNLIGKASHM